MRKNLDATDFKLNEQLFNDAIALEARIRNIDGAFKGKLKTVLEYLYLNDGPNNLSRKDQLRPVEPFLSLAEVKVARWLATLTNGTRSRKLYGRKALHAFRQAKGKCLFCGCGDVRCLEIDHSNSIRSADSPQQCLCANCHRIETYNRLLNKI